MTKYMLEHTSKELRLKVDEHREEAYITCQENCWCWAIEAFADLIEEYERTLKAKEETEKAARRLYSAQFCSYCDEKAEKMPFEDFVEAQNQAGCSWCNYRKLVRWEERWEEGTPGYRCNGKLVRWEEHWEEGAPGYRCNGDDKENPREIIIYMEADCLPKVKANRHCHRVRIVRELSGISGELTDHAPDVGKEEE